MKIVTSALIAAAVVGWGATASAQSARHAPAQQEFSAYYGRRDVPAPQTYWQTPSQPYNSSGFAGPSGAAATANTLGY